MPRASTMMRISLFLNALLLLGSVLPVGGLGAGIAWATARSGPDLEYYTYDEINALCNWWEIAYPRAFHRFRDRGRSPGPGRGGELGAAPVLPGTLAE